MILPKRSCPITMHGACQVLLTTELSKVFGTQRFPWKSNDMEEILEGALVTK
jgi:hypothetical protein